MEKPFSDHLADAYQQVTTRQLDKNQLWSAFQAMDQVPQLIRSLVERLALNPSFSIEQAKESVLRDLYHDRSYSDIWSQLSGLERLVLGQIAQGGGPLYSEGVLQEFAQALGIDALNPSTIQSALRSLSRKEIIIKSVLKKRYVIDDPNLNSWVKNSGS